MSGRTGLLLAFTLLASPPIHAKERLAASAEGGAPTTSEGTLALPDTELIDVPSAAVLTQGGFSSRTRFFNRGGVLEWLNFGVYPRVNIGASFNIDKFIGSDSPVQLTRPELQLKLRFYDGDRTIPALAVGFDGQGFLYNRNERRFNQRQRGLYLMGTQEIGLPGLQGHAGTNISDFDGNYVFGFLALDYDIENKVKLMAEWDNIRNYMDSRVNLGMRVYLTRAFAVEFSARGIGQGGWYNDGVHRTAERVAQFRYTGHF